MNKDEIRTRIEEIGIELAAIEKRTSVDVRPWVTNDDPTSIRHWSLLQERWQLREKLKKPTFTTEQRAAAGKRLQQAREARKLASLGL